MQILNTYLPRLQEREMNYYCVNVLTVNLNFKKGKNINKILFITLKKT